MADVLSVVVSPGTICFSGRNHITLNTLHFSIWVYFFDTKIKRSFDKT